VQLAAAPFLARYSGRTLEAYRDDLRGRGGRRSVHHGRPRRRGADGEQLDELRPTAWGERWPAGQILAVLLDEQVHHGAEIALLRDRYRARP
jgi:hypothetical protein